MSTLTTQDNLQEHGRRTDTWVPAICPRTRLLQVASATGIPCRRRGPRAIGQSVRQIVMRPKAVRGLNQVVAIQNGSMVRPGAALTGILPHFLVRRCAPPVCRMAHHFYPGPDGHSPVCHPALCPVAIRPSMSKVRRSRSTHRQVRRDALLSPLAFGGDIHDHLTANQRRRTRRQERCDDESEATPVKNTFYTARGRLTC